MKAYAESFGIYHKRAEERERERAQEKEDYGELYPKYIEKFSIYRENKRSRDKIEGQD